MLASRSGKYFIRNANLWLLKKDPVKWRQKQQAQDGAKADVSRGAVKSSRVVQPLADVAPSADAKKAERKKKKRKRAELEEAAGPEDEIDEIFSAPSKKGVAAPYS